jgi:hypothetical protein
MHDENLETFITRIAAEEFLPLPREVPRDDSEEWDHLDWEDIEPRDAALTRIWIGKAAEVLSRDFGSFQRATRAQGEAPGVSWWYLFSEEPLWIPNDRSILFWTVDGSKRNWYFARRPTRKECEALIRLIANRDMNH